MTNSQTAERADEQTTTAGTTVVGHLDDFPEGAMKVVRVGERRVLMIRTAKGLFALDNACPHQGYGLALGDLTESTVTCLWHNWKFKVDTGACEVGEEAVTSHHVRIGENGAVSVSLQSASVSDLLPRLHTSLRSAIDRNYTGQMARDVVRLLQNSANPGELVWSAVEWGAPRSEWGWGHSIAMATDCLTIATRRQGIDCALPVVQALSGIAEEQRGEQVMTLPDPIAVDPRLRAEQFRQAVEREETSHAQAILRGALLDGAPTDEIRAWLISASTDHMLSYGHGAIYVQKAFELLDHLGWERADTVLGHLVPAIVYGTREDRLPYMKPFMRAVAGYDRDSIEVLTNTSVGRDSELIDLLLNSHDRTAFLRRAMVLARDGVSVDSLLDHAVEVVSERMLRYNTAEDFELADDFGWLDMTHGITFANAARWQWHHHPGPDTFRQALFALWLAHWTGRHEWHTTIGPRVNFDEVGPAGNLTEEALTDRSGSFIVAAHAVKLSVAAEIEGARAGSDLPLLATARFLRTPKMERFVARNVVEATEFLTGRKKRDA